MRLKGFETCLDCSLCRECEGRGERCIACHCEHDGHGVVGHFKFVIYIGREIV